MAIIFATLRMMISFKVLEFATWFLALGTSITWGKATSPKL